jgi:pimeloyl-ACP methyl ester carboxylesterase
MKTNNLKKRILAASAIFALSTTALVAAPSVATAAPSCNPKADATYGVYQECVGVTSDGARYVIQLPWDFGGTLFLYTHGYRYPVDIPTLGYTVGKTPEPAPGRSPAEIQQMSMAMLSKGYAVAGSGFTRKGWNADDALKTNVELIKLIRSEFPEVTKIIAWGSSLGAYITQGLSERNSKLISAAGLLCPAAGSVEASLKMAGDALWGIKAFLDPTIQGGNYKSVLQVYSDMNKIAVALRTVGANIKENATFPAWPATAVAPVDALKPAFEELKKNVPSRSAVVLIAAMAGVPTQSKSFDGTTGAGDATTAYSFASAISPALGALENLGDAATLGVLATYDLERDAGGPIFDNTATNYAVQLGDTKREYASALSGSDATNAMLAYLAAFPKMKGDAAAIEKMRTLLTHKGNFKVPTITMAATADNVTPAGNQQWLIDAAAAKKSKNLLALWQRAANSYTTFTAAGPVQLDSAIYNGTGHCTTTVTQHLAIADLLAASSNGKLVDTKTVRKAIKAAGGITYDPTFTAPLLKFYQK